MLDGDRHIVDLARYRERRERERRRQNLDGLEKRPKLTFALFRGYRPHRKQAELHTCGARFAAVVAGRRGGKTYAGGREFLRRIFEDDLPIEIEKVRQGKRRRWKRPERLGKKTKPFLHYWCVAPTYDLGSFQQQEIFEVLGGEDSPAIDEWRESEYTLWLRGGIKIEFKSAERDKRLVGSGLHGLWLDEAARIKESAWSENLYPTLAENQGWCLFTTTPLGKNWVWREIWQRTQYGPPEKQDPEFYGLHFRTSDNTHKPALVAEARLAKKRLPLAEYLRNYEASFDAFRGKVYESFVDGDMHLFGDAGATGVNRAAVAKTYDRVIAGVDWGYVNPGTIVVVGLSSDGSAEVIHEEYATKINVSPVVDRDEDCWSNRMKRIAKTYGVERFYADPADAENLAACRKAGVTITAARNAVIPGISVVGAMLEPRERRGGQVRPSLRIHRRCANLRRELGSYQWQDDEEAPKKVDDHTCDALRYALYTEHVLSPTGLDALKGLSIYEHAA